MKKIILALILTLNPVLSYASCGLPPLPPLPPLGTEECVPVCICDEHGVECRWEFQCR
jgi:hypothetical protein